MGGRGQLGGVKAQGKRLGSKAFVQLGGDEVNKLQKMPSRHSVGDHEPRLGSLVGQVLKDNRVFSQGTRRNSAGHMATFKQLATNQVR